MDSFLRTIVSIVIVVALSPLVFLTLSCTGITYQSGRALKGIYSTQVAALPAISSMNKEKRGDVAPT